MKIGTPIKFYYFKCVGKKFSYPFLIMKANFQEVSEFHLNKRKLFHQFFTLPLNLNSHDVLIEHYKSVFNSKYLV